MGGRRARAHGMMSPVSRAAAAPRTRDDELRGGIRPLLFPRSLAVVGATPRSPEPVLSALQGDARAWGVNPGRAEVLGLPCVPRVADLPEVPELAVLVVGHTRVEAAFEEAAEAGVGAFV